MYFHALLDYVPMTKVILSCNDFVSEKTLEFSDFGDGIPRSFQGNGGHLLVLWDRNNNADMSLLTHDEMKESHENFVNQFTN